MKRTEDKFRESRRSLGLATSLLEQSMLQRQSLMAQEMPGMEQNSPMEEEMAPMQEAAVEPEMAEETPEMEESEEKKGLVASVVEGVKGILKSGGKEKLEEEGQDVGAPGNKPAKPESEEERVFIENANKAGYHVVRDPSGELIAVPNYPPPTNPSRNMA